jgi:dTMP kinase
VKTILKSTSRGFFVVLEGLDGAGKTSIAYRLIEDLRSMGYRAEYTYEPYDTDFVRALKEKYNSYRDAYLDALTYAADRLIHYRSVIEPVLESGGIVICDRYYYSSVAYQSAQGADPEWVLIVNRYAPDPDIAIYLDVEPETGLRRRRGLYTRFPEYEKLDFLMNVRKYYLWMVERGLLKLVDANRGFEEVYNDVYRLVMDLFR